MGKSANGLSQFEYDLIYSIIVHKLQPQCISNANRPFATNL